MNTVAPPISEHETLELWLTHPLIGYAGVEGVVYRAWTRILEQTESGELVVVWSAPDSSEGLEERGMYPVEGWQAGWELAQKEVTAVRSREEKNPVGRGKENNRKSACRAPWDLINDPQPMFQSLPSLSSCTFNLSLLLYHSPSPTFSSILRPHPLLHHLPNHETTFTSSLAYTTPPTPFNSQLPHSPALPTGLRSSMNAVIGWRRDWWMF